MDRISMLTVAMIIASAFSAFGLARLFTDIMMANFSGVYLDAGLPTAKPTDDSIFATFYTLSPYLALMAWAAFFVLVARKRAGMRMAKTASN